MYVIMLLADKYNFSFLICGYYLIFFLPCWIGKDLQYSVEQKGTSLCCSWSLGENIQFSPLNMMLTVEFLQIQIEEVSFCYQFYFEISFFLLFLFSFIMNRYGTCQVIIPSCIESLWIFFLNVLYSQVHCLILFFFLKLFLG